MKTSGKLESLAKSMRGEPLATFRLDGGCINELQDLGSDKQLDIEIKVHREKRSLDANALYWACISDLAKAQNESKDDVHLEMLRKYGQYTYIAVKKHAVEAVKRQWRETEEKGEVIIEGQRCVQMLCFYSTTVYDSEEFSKLLNGVIREMDALGLTIPPPRTIQRSIEKWQETKS